jgi:hypothetical protein
VINTLNLPSRIKDPVYSDLEWRLNLAGQRLLVQTRSVMVPQALIDETRATRDLLDAQLRALPVPPYSAAWLFSEMINLALRHVDVASSGLKLWGDLKTGPYGNYDWSWAAMVADQIRIDWYSAVIQGVYKKRLFSARETAGLFAACRSEVNSRVPDDASGLVPDPAYPFGEAEYEILGQMRFLLDAFWDHFDFVVRILAQPDLYVEDEKEKIDILLAADLASHGIQV